VEEGSLYPALYRLEEKGLITAEWGITEFNRRAKFYRLTTSGKKQLRTSHDYWARYTGAVSKVLETAPRPA
jgi:PadR family transcriptional regulator PadR